MDPTQLVATISPAAVKYAQMTWPGLARGAWLAAAKEAEFPVVNVDYTTLAPGVAGRVMVGDIWYDIIAGTAPFTVTVTPTPIITDPNEMGNFNYEFGAVTDTPFWE